MNKPIKLTNLFMVYISSCFFVGVMTCSAQLDLDADGMSDVWEKKYSAENADPNVDYDDDGVLTIDESVAGTDPYDKASVFRLSRYDSFPRGMSLQWLSEKGISYQLQKSNDLVGPWQNLGESIPGHGGDYFYGINHPSGDQAFFRLEIKSEKKDPFWILGTDNDILNLDADGDGVNNREEIRIKTNPFDAQEKYPTLAVSTGAITILEWLSITGKNYQLQSAIDPNLAWEDEGGGLSGNGHVMTTAVITKSNQSKYYRILVTDIDTDEDGLSDWEEYLVGLDPETPMTEVKGDGDLMALRSRLLTKDVLSVNASRAVANITSMENGGFLIEREGGIGELTVNYTITGTAIAGSDYEILAGVATIPFGADSVEVAIKPVASSAITLSETVILTLSDNELYDLSSQNSQQVNVLKEVAINVKDYGAVGDGVNDDTAAVQLAIDALEASIEHNTLFFPQGTYLLATYVGIRGLPTGSARLLLLGSNDLGGRDLIFRGESGARLFSNVSPQRAHVIVAYGSFRSLEINTLVIEQDDRPLSSMSNREPNGADGITLMRVDKRIVESFVVKNSKFINCHGAVRIYGSGYDVRGLLKLVSFESSEFLNPYGANTINSLASWGGGQQFYIAPWVDKANYTGNIFDGGGDDMTDESTSPGGRLKDGCHFGCPLSLIFEGNVVKHMGVEAVIQINDNTYMGNTTSDFEMPLFDGTSSVSFFVSNTESTYPIGGVINIRSPATPGGSASNNSLKITDFNPVSRQITVESASEANVTAGTVITSGKYIYLDSDSDPSRAYINNNYLDGTIPPGGAAFREQAAIVFSAHANIESNVIVNWGNAIRSSLAIRTPLHPPARYSVIRNNIIMTRDASLFEAVRTYGINVWGGDEQILGNLIHTPTSKRVAGIVSRGNNGTVNGNYVKAFKSIWHDYEDYDRSVGIASWNSSSNTRMINNTTSGFDAGVGPLQAYQYRGNIVIGHTSIGDKIAIDPVGSN